MKRARETDPLSVVMCPSPDETSEQRTQREGALAAYHCPCFAWLYLAMGPMLILFMRFGLLTVPSRQPAREREAKRISDQIDAEIEVERKRIKHANNIKILLLGMPSNCFVGVCHSLSTLGQSESGKR